MTKQFASLSILSLSLCAALAQAQAVPTELLTTTNDGAGSDVQSLLNSVGAGVDVSLDQSAERIFTQSGSSMTWTYEWSRAGLAGQHRMGYYSIGDPSSISWVLGNVNQDGNQVTSWTGSISGNYGMVLDNGIGNLFFSESGLNSDTALASSNSTLDGFDRRNHVVVFAPAGDSLFLSWEDLPNVDEVAAGGLLDYNDYGYRLEGAAPVPEPGTMIALGAAAAALAARRRRKAS
jgi:hypothetical protein